MHKILIKNATLLTMNDGPKVFKKAAILIEDKYIKEIYYDNKCLIEVDEIIDAKNNLVMPGLINMHTHVPMTVLRNFADDSNLED
ncbi:UNVERIFIED_CONTAM: hypothetical protein O8I53_09430 [Campylobacter lari]